ncbi:MAG: flotillin family protein [Anaerolineales bacterium]|nr:flotillin family protein [Anaerolineales bacterium]
MGFELAIVGIVLLFVIVLILGIVFASRFKKVGPNQVLVISGRKSAFMDSTTGQKSRRSFRIVRGGGAFIVPVLERVDLLSLELITIEVITQNVYTLQGVPVTVDGVAQVKIASDDVSIVTAAEQFLSKNQVEIKNVALQTLEGHLRAILGTMTVEEIYKDRDKFAQTVQSVSAQDMRNMGLQIISFTIKNIHDTESYLDSLGKARTAEVQRDAQIGQARAARDAAIESAKARQEGEIAQIEANTKIAEADRDYKIKKAEYDTAVNRQQADADLAYTLQQNITSQKVKEQEVQVAVVEKRKQIEVQEQEALRRERELEATVKKPAEAEQFRVKTLADAKRYQLEVEADGQAIATRNIGIGEADANKARGLADVDVVKARGITEAEVNKAKGMTEAEVIKAQGLSEAEAMRRKAEAWEQYTQAAILQFLIQNLPALAGAIAEPMSKTEKIVVINSGGEGSGTGVSKVTQDVTNLLAQMPEIVNSLTGVDLLQAIKSLPGLKQQQAVRPSEGSPAVKESTESNDEIKAAKPNIRKRAPKAEMETPGEGETTEK